MSVMNLVLVIFSPDLPMPILVLLPLLPLRPLNVPPLSLAESDASFLCLDRRKAFLDKNLNRFLPFSLVFPLGAMLPSLGGGDGVTVTSVVEFTMVVLGLVAVPVLIMELFFKGMPMECMPL